MLNNALTVAGQVFTLFIIMALGFVCAKTKIVRDHAIRDLTNLVLYCVTPAAILQAFTSEECTPEKTKNLLWVLLFSIAIHAILILLAKLCIHNKPDTVNKVLRYAVIFSNCGYMAFPLQKAILGDIGVFYGSMYVAVFNILAWSYGVVMCSGDKKFLSPRKIFLNPTVISVILSVILYFSGLKLPTVISSAVTHIGNLNTPLPMLIVGYRLYSAGIVKSFTDKRIYLPVALRLIVSPAIMIGIMVLCGVKGAPLIACTVAASSSVAAYNTMFADKFGLDSEVSVKTVTVSTLLTIFTMPLFVALAQVI
ncbi:MAG: AEC family transporter [Clostridiales bacterium]|nr:AEC family transporter [Candidatus Equinaster intestinalis]